MGAVDLAASCQDLDNSDPIVGLPRTSFLTTALRPVSPDAPEIEILRRGRWFASLPPALQARIAKLGVLRQFRTGQYLLRLIRRAACSGSSTGARGTFVRSARSGKC